MRDCVQVMARSLEVEAYKHLLGCLHEADNARRRTGMSIASDTCSVIATEASFRQRPALDRIRVFTRFSG